MPPQTRHVTLHVDPWPSTPQEQLTVFLTPPVTTSGQQLHVQYLRGQPTRRLLGRAGTLLHRHDLQRGQTVQLTARITTTPAARPALFVPETPSSFLTLNAADLALRDRVWRAASSSLDFTRRLSQHLADTLPAGQTPDVHDTGPFTARRSVAQRYTALCLSAGLPARTVFGWLAGLRISAPHVWSEVQLGPATFPVDVALARLTPEDLRDLAWGVGGAAGHTPVFGRVTRSHVTLSYGHLHPVEPVWTLSSAGAEPQDGTWCLPWVLGAYGVMPGDEGAVTGTRLFTVTSTFGACSQDGAC